MPINPGITTPIFDAMLVGHGLAGVGTPQLAAGLALGLFQYMQIGCQVLSINTGTLGPGVGAGIGILISEPVLSEILLAALLGNGIIGPFSSSMADAIASGIALSLATAIMTTTSSTVGIGAGKLQCIPNGSGTAVFTESFIASGMGGMMIPPFAAAIALAMDTVIATSLGVLAIVGTPNIIPSVGISVILVQ